MHDYNGSDPEWQDLLHRLPWSWIWFASALLLLATR